MTKIKKELIFIYTENARIKIKELAKLFKESSQRIKYSLNVFEKERVIYNPYCIFDYSYFGLILFRVYFKGAYISEKDKSEIIKKLYENEYVVSIYELSGEFDLVVEIQSPNPSRFNKVLKNLSTTIPTLSNYKIILNLVTHIYPHLYLTNEDYLHSQVPSQIIIGGDRSIENFSSNEMTVTNNLLNNPKMWIKTLAKQSNLHTKTVKSVLQNLNEKKVIKGFKYVIDNNKLNIYKFRLFLKLHNLIKDREKDLMEYMLKKKEIVQAHKTVGDWDLEIDIESPDKILIRKLTIEIRESFKDIIETFNIMEFYQYYKKSYLPSYLFNPIQSTNP